MKRKKFLYLTIGSTAFAALPANYQQLLSSNRSVSSHSKSVNFLSLAEHNTVNLDIDWSSAISTTTPLVFGSNDYEIMYPKQAADLTFQNLLTELDIRLIRIHHAKLSEKWSNSSTKSWNESKIKAGYDASYSHEPKIVQTIPRWPNWMKQDSNSLLDYSEYNNYANFCAELVRILNRTQNRQITYWEPFNELDSRYKDLGKLDELWKIYNTVAARMKKVDSRIKLGGPVLTWDDSQTLNHFLNSCSQNVDFISWHRYASGDAKDTTEKIMSFTPKYGEQTRKFRSIVTKHISERKIPLFLSEYNINYSWDSGETRQNTHVGAVWFASVLKYLAEAEIDMAASWHLKDGIYGMFDPQNNLRPSATVFAWANRFLIGKVVHNESDRSGIEALPIQQQNGKRSLLVINKTSAPANINLKETHGYFQAGETKIHSLNADGIKVFNANKQTDLITFALSPYSILLLRSLKPFSDSD